ncbi:MAG: type IV pilus secretin PilQ [Myxococcota bacterium]
MSSMLANRSGQFRIAATLFCAVGWVVGVTACAGTQATAVSSLSLVETISEIRVDREGSDTVVMLSGVYQPVFTAFYQTDPDRVVVDVVSARVDASFETVSVHDGLVTEIHAGSHSSDAGDPAARIEIQLDAPADYEIHSVAGGLEIRILAGLAADDSGTVAFDPWSSNQAAEASTESSSSWANDVASDPATTVDEAWSEGADDSVVAVAAVSATPATQVTQVEVEQLADGTLVRILADGLVGNVVTFTLDDPARLVIDLAELLLATDVVSIDVGSPEAARVRVGQHADKLRVVIDAGDADSPFDGRRVVPAPAGLMVALGRGDGIDAALAAETSMSPVMAQVAEPAVDVAVLEPSGDALDADGTTMLETPETEMAVTAGDWEPESEVAGTLADAEPMEDSATDAAPGLASESMEIPEITVMTEAAEVVQAELAVEPVDATVEPVEMDVAVATVYGIEFDTQATRDRIVVLGDQVLDYFVFEPSPDTLIVNIEGSRIDPEAAVRIAPEPGGPVSLVTAFGQPELDRPQVRVVVQRAPNLVPEITRRGSLLVIDFPRTGAVAAASPLMAAQSEELAASMAAETSSGAALAPASIAAVAAKSGTPETDSVHHGANVPNPVASVAPAAQEPGASIDVLQEGGLIDGKVYTGRRVSLDFKEVEITDVLRLIAEVSELNVIAGDEVKGKVTIRLVDVPWDQALDVVLLTKGLGFMRIGNVLRIAPSTVIAQEEEMRLQERRAKEKLEDLVVKLQPVNYADVTQVSAMIGQLLSARGSVNVDTRTNTLILKDIPTVVDEATALIKAIDTQTPQVLIETKIVEASLDFSREFGAQWGLGAQPLVDGFDASSGVRQNLGGNDLNFHNSASSSFFGNNAVFSNPITASPTGLFNLAAFLLDQKLNLELQLQAAEVSGEGKVISSPRVVTLDNSKASIEQGVSIPFQTFENGDAQLEFVDAVLKLEVTPHITANKSIIMKITVNRNAPDTSVFTLTGSPAIAKNQVTTETLVKDGQTLVLGGIYVIDKSDRESRVPYLHRIPFIGAAFRSNEHSELRKELLIFVTPRIIQTPESDF